jgi:Arc/MetJ family transcription regulator
MLECALLMHIRTTRIIDDELPSQARKLTGIDEKTALAHAGLRVLIEREAGDRLAALAGTQPKLPDILRRRSV